MDVFKLFEKDACDIRGKFGSDKRTWQEYFTNKKELESQWVQVVLVDMIGHPVDGSITISNDLFMGWTYPEGTYFILYCHSWWTSGYVQKQLKVMTPHYNVINMDWGIYAYSVYKLNN